MKIYRKRKDLIILTYKGFKELYLDKKVKPYLSLHIEKINHYFDDGSDAGYSKHYFILLDQKYLLSVFNKTNYDYGWIPIEFADSNVLYKDLPYAGFDVTRSLNYRLEQFPVVDKYNDYENIKYHYEKCREFEIIAIDEHNEQISGWGYGKNEGNYSPEPPKYLDISSFPYSNFLTQEKYDKKTKLNKRRFQIIKKLTFGLIDIIEYNN